MISEHMEALIAALFQLGDEEDIAVAVVVGNRDGEAETYGQCCTKHARLLLRAGLEVEVKKPDIDIVRSELLQVPRQ